MKLSHAFLTRRDEPQAKREERDANDEIVPACVGVKHRWAYVRPSVMKCTKCGQVKYAPAR